MKAKLVLPVLIVIFLATSVPALATDASTLRQQIRQNRRDTRSELIDNREELKTATGTPGARPTFRKNRAEIIYKGLLNAFNTRSNLLNTYEDRIKTRLSEKSAKLPNNTSLTDAQNKLNNIDNTLKPQFQADLTAFSSQYTTISTSTEPKNLLTGLKTQTNKVRQDLIDIQKALVYTLRSVVKAK